MRLPDKLDLDLIRRKGYRPQVVGCFVNNKRILFLFDNNYKIWQFPQGGVDNGETLQQALIREMAEELGNKVAKCMQVKDLVGTYELNFRTKSKKLRELESDNGKAIKMIGKRYFFFAIEMHSDAIHIDQTEFNELAWNNYEEALNRAKAIKQYGKKSLTLVALKKLKSRGFI